MLAYGAAVAPSNAAKAFKGISTSSYQRGSRNVRETHERKRRSSAGSGVTAAERNAAPASAPPSPTKSPMNVKALAVAAAAAAAAGGADATSCFSGSTSRSGYAIGGSVSSAAASDVCVTLETTCSTVAQPLSVEAVAQLWARAGGTRRDLQDLSSLLQSMVGGAAIDDSTTSSTGRWARLVRGTDALQRRRPPPTCRLAASSSASSVSSMPAPENREPRVADGALPPDEAFLAAASAAT